MSTSLPATDDLNQRVQARFADFDVLLHMFNRPDVEGIAFAVWTMPSIMAPLVASWRERWERHQPYFPTTPGSGCWICSSDESPTPWPCPDALSVCREIRVEV